MGAEDSNASRSKKGNEIDARMLRYKTEGSVVQMDD